MFGCIVNPRFFPWHTSLSFINPSVLFLLRQSLPRSLDSFLPPSPCIESIRLQWHSFPFSIPSRTPSIGCSICYILSHVSLWLACPCICKVCVKGDWLPYTKTITARATATTTKTITTVKKTKIGYKTETKSRIKTRLSVLVPDPWLHRFISPFSDITLS